MLSNGVVPPGEDHTYQNGDVKCVASYLLMAEGGMWTLVGWQQQSYNLKWQAGCLVGLYPKCWEVPGTCLCVY